MAEDAEHFSMFISHLCFFCSFLGFDFGFGFFFPVHLSIYWLEDLFLVAILFV